MDGAYTLTLHMFGRTDARIKVLIYDPDGQLRWYHFLGTEASGDVDQQFLGDRVLFGGGYAIQPTLVDLDGNVLWTAPVQNGDGHCNHHAEMLPDGNVMYLTTEPNASGTADWTGFVVRVIDPATDELVWSWHSQDVVGTALPVPSDPNDNDPYHANALQWIDDDTGHWLLISMRNQNTLMRVDRDTGAVDWRMGPAHGDFALVDANGDALPASEWFYTEHAPELHGDQLYLYDNGSGRPDGNFSRAVHYTIDWDARTITPVWSFDQPTWFEPIWGDIDLMPSGHILVTEAHCDNCGTPNMRTRIVEVEPTTNDVVWQLEFEGNDDASYRSERLGGCDVFANAEWCPALANP
jgi:hypothetical protein